MDTVALVGRLLVSLAAVLGVMWLLARRARKGVKKKGTRMIEVLDRASLSRSASVAVVRVNGRAFVLGVAESQVTILGETGLDGAETAADAALPAVPAVPAAPARTSRGVDHGASGHPHTGHPASDRPLGAGGGHRAAPRVQPARGARQPEQQTGALAGSALSPQTWKQTIESLRDLTTRA